MSLMGVVSIFTHGIQSMHTTIIDGEPWFVASDVATILELGNVRSSLALLDEDEKGVHTVDTLGGPQSMTVISESGLYSLVLRSRKPEAKEFKRWITREVIPAIRKTGTYSTPAAIPALTDDQVVQKAFNILVAKTAELEAKVTALAPSAEAWDELASATGDYSVGESSKILARAGVETGPNRLFAQLADLNWIFRDGHYVWTAYASAVDSGYVTLKPASHPHPRTGERIVDPPQVRITVKGLDRLRVRLGALVLT